MDCLQSSIKSGTLIKMAYTNQYEHDIFISYSHVDNQTTDESEGWVDSFHKKLNLALNQCIGEANKIKIFRDKELKGNEEFDVILEKRIHTTALFVALTSTGYLKSNYCQKELQCFYDRASSSETGLSIDGKYRIFNVLIADIPHENFPKYLGRTVCFKCHEQGSFWPFSFDEAKMKQQIRKLAVAIHETIEQLNACQAANQKIVSDNDESDTASQPLSLFFADVPDSLSDDRQLAMTELSDAGYHILDTIPPPFDASHDQVVVKAAQTAFMSIHLFDQFPTKKIQTDDLSYDQHQLNLCLSHGQSQWIWVPSDLNIENIKNKRHQQFLQEIENREDQSSYSFIRGNSSHITRGIMETIQQLKKTSKNHETQMNHNKVLLSVNQKDSDDADSLINFFGMNNFIPLINKVSDDPMEKLEDFENQLCQTGALVLIFNRVSFEWVTKRMMIAYQSIVVHNYPIQKLAIYVPNADERNLSIPIHPLIENRVCICKQMQCLLEYIQSGGVA